MIIGNNNNLPHNQNILFNGKNSDDQSETSLQDSDMMREKNRALQHTDVMSKSEMKDKSFAMLQDRLNKGLISMEEFNKMCNLLGKQK